MKNWLDKGVKCVIVCGGRGSRLNPITADLAKSMVEIKGKPIIGHILDYWQKYVAEFVFVLGYKGQDIADYVKARGIRAKFIFEEGKPAGIANALRLAQAEVGDKFVVVLGDCLAAGSFAFPEEFDQGVGVWDTAEDADIKRSYSVELEKDRISRVVEKPAKLVNRWCGLGFYFFRKKFFGYLDKTPPSGKTGNIELTDVIQTMIEAGEKISPVKLEGKYLNVTFPEDLKRAEHVV